MELSQRVPGAAMLRDTPFAVVDVETTGGSAAGGDRITEIAVVVVEGGRVAHAFETLVNPERPIPPWITRLTGISTAMVRDKPTFRELCGELQPLLGGRVFVAHNASFDWAFVGAELQRATGRGLEGERLCTVRLARRLLPGLRRRSLDHLTHHFGIPNDARHRAGGDARATAQVLLRLLDEAHARGLGSWDDLARLLAARTGAGRRRRGAGAPPPPDLRDLTA